MKRLILSLLVAISTLSHAQTYSIHLEPVQVPNFGGLQSFAVGQDNGKILLIGGRLDGLHRRQPWASFDAAGHNNRLIVIEPSTGATWSADLTSLSSNLQLQLKSTNMEFIQRDDILYLFGGYGLNASSVHMTFPYIAAVDVPAVIQAVINNQSIAPHIRQYTNSNFKVTGGQIYRLHDTYYMVGGQLFDGSYNPMGPTHGPGFTQVYTDEVRRFTIADDGTNLTVNFDTVYHDGTLLHKRDYNAVPTYHQGSLGILALSGVFQIAADVPWTNAIFIDSTHFAEVPNFTQYYNHYHSAKASLYNPSTGQMSYYIFGGIAQYYLQNGTRIKDDNVPFVKTISRLDWTANGTLTETPLGVEMPDYLGAGAEFIPLESLSLLPNEIIDMSQLSGDTIPIGYIVGGIKSSAPNIFFINTGTESISSPTLYRVSLVNSTVGTIETSSTKRATLLPNPANDRLIIRMAEGALLQRIVWTDNTGRILRTDALNAADLNGSDYSLSISDLPRGVYSVSLDFQNGTSEVIMLSIQ